MFSRSARVDAEKKPNFAELKAARQSQARTASERSHVSAGLVKNQAIISFLAVESLARCCQTCQFHAKCSGPKCFDFDAHSWVGVSKAGLDLHTCIVILSRILPSDSAGV